jgi:hypothetical protein
MWLHRMLVTEILGPGQQSPRLYSEILSKDGLDRVIIQSRVLPEESERLYRDWMDQEEKRHTLHKQVVTPDRRHSPRPEG